MKRSLLFLAALLLIPALPSMAQVHGVGLSWQWSQGTGAPCTVGYDIYRATSAAGPFLQALGTSPATVPSCLTLSYEDPTGGTNGVVSGTTYYYVVTAVGAGGQSINSNVAAVTFQLPVNPPNPLSGLSN